MNNLLEERDERTRQRKKDKKRHDQEINLAVNKEKKTLSFTHPVKNLNQRQRLLDEGAIEADGWIDCFIMRGTIEKFLTGNNLYLDNIDDSYEGNVNLGHLDFAIFPFIIGTWTKKDLHLVDLEDNRKAVDVDLHLDEESIFVQELARMPYDIGISAEFYFHVNEEETEKLYEERGEYIEVIDEILIKAYGLVGECGNVNSDGLQLKGGSNMKDMKDMVIEEETVEEKEESIEETVEETVEEDIATEESEEEESVDTATEETVEEEIIEEVEDEEEVEGEEDEDEESGFDELSAIIDELTNENKELKATVKALKQKNKKLRNKLDAKSESIDEFVNKFKGLSINLGLKKEEEKEEVVPEETKVYAGNDGIGE